MFYKNFNTFLFTNVEIHSRNLMFLSQKSHFCVKLLKHSFIYIFNSVQASMAIYLKQNMSTQKSYSIITLNRVVLLLKICKVP